MRHSNANVRPRFGIARLGGGLLLTVLLVGGLFVAQATAGERGDCPVACNTSSAAADATMSWAYPQPTETALSWSTIGGTGPAASETSPAVVESSSGLSWSTIEGTGPATADVQDNASVEASGLSWSTIGGTGPAASETSPAVAESSSGLSWSMIEGTGPATADVQDTASVEASGLSWSTIGGTGPAASETSAEAVEASSGLSWSTIGGVGPAAMEEAPADAAEGLDQSDEPVVQASGQPSREAGGIARVAVAAAVMDSPAGDAPPVHQRLAELTRTVRDLRGQVSELQREMRELRSAAGDI